MRIGGRDCTSDEAILTGEGSLMCMSAAALFAKPAWSQVRCSNHLDHAKRHPAHFPCDMTCCEISVGSNSADYVAGLAWAAVLGHRFIDDRTNMTFVPNFGEACPDSS